MTGGGPLYGAVEGGGTKFVCLVGRGPTDVVAETRIPTTSPDATLAATIAFLRGAADRHGSLSAVGVGSFGPVDVHPGSKRFGRITSTPKPGWSDTDVAGPIRRALSVPVAFDTDTNAAALAEREWGAARGLDTFLYLTIGTGIGGGGFVEGRLLHGLVHPEVGHLHLPRDPAADPFPGACPFHGDCLEGLASGPALQARWGVPAESLPADHPAWALEVRYLALAVVNLVCTLSPQRIVMGGGVMEQSHLFPPLRREVQRLRNGYVRASAILDRIDEYVVPPGLGPRAGVLGALALARHALSEA